MSGSLFDTNVLSRYIERDAGERYPTLVGVVTEALREGGFYISSVTKYELRRGVRKLRLGGGGRRKEIAVERLLDAAHIISPDAWAGAAWDAAADLWAVASSRGLSLGDAALIIAATAQVADRVLVTCDSKLVEGLDAVDFAGQIRRHRFKV